MPFDRLRALRALREAPSRLVDGRRGGGHQRNPQWEAMTMKHLSVSEAARRLKARPRDISDLFYRRHLRDDLCPRRPSGSPGQ